MPGQGYVNRGKQAYTSLSASFHGRDLYAPTAAMIRKNKIPGAAITWKDQHGWPDDLEEIVYIDHFGNG